MGHLSEETRRALRSCDCSDADVAQVSSLVACGSTDEAVLRLRRHRARLMDDLHERQAKVDRLDAIVREMKRGA